MTEQIRNDQLVEILRPDFFARYEPNASMVHASAHLMLPQLRGYWPMSSVNESGNPYDLSGQGRTLTNNDSIPYGVYNLLPYADLTPNDYFSRPDEAGLDITGAISFGGWFWLDTIAANQDLMSKWDAGTNNRSYILWFNNATGVLVCSISSLGTAASTLHLSHTTVLSASAWYHVVGRCNPGTEQSIFVDGVEVSTGAGVPAAIFNSNAPLEIGYSVGGSYMNGRTAQCFLCADDLDDVVIKTINEQTRANYGK